MTIIVASAPSWTDIVTAIGTVLAGLALPLAFIQLGALRQDRLRAQVSKAGAWTGMPEQTGEEPGLWTIPVLIRNGSDLSLFGWVLCALPHQRPVAVAGEVWQALRAAGAGALGEDPLAAVGFPTPSPQATQVVDADATGMELTGGHWRKGKLVRAPGEAAWRWEPAVRFSMDVTRAAGYWTADPAARQLRLRAVATLPRADASELAISSQNRLDLEKALPESDLAGRGSDFGP